MGCIFCSIINGELEGVFIHKNDDAVVFLDKYPIDYGHALVVTKNHYERITDMKEADVGRLFCMVPKMARAIMSATDADAFSIAQNNGKAARQIVPHVHIHIIPRYNNKGTIWTKRRIADSKEREELAVKIRAQL